MYVDLHTYNWESDLPLSHANIFVKVASRKVCPRPLITWVRARVEVTDFIYSGAILQISVILLSLGSGRIRQIFILEV